MADHIIFGKEGEEQAVKFLEEKGYKIIERNWRGRKVEIDIIATKDHQLIIVEVKSRKTNVFGEPEEFVNRVKQKNLIHGAQEFFYASRLGLEIRFDIISVLAGKNEMKINHIQDAFYPMIS